jgi:hypothetical protein
VIKIAEPKPREVYQRAEQSETSPSREALRFTKPLFEQYEHKCAQQTDGTKTHYNHCVIIHGPPYLGTSVFLLLRYLLKIHD